MFLPGVFSFSISPIEPLVTSIESSGVPVLEFLRVIVIASPTLPIQVLVTLMSFCAFGSGVFLLTIVNPSVWLPLTIPSSKPDTLSSPTVYVISFPASSYFGSSLVTAHVIPSALVAAAEAFNTILSTCAPLL